MFTKALHSSLQKKYLYWSIVYCLGTETDLITLRVRQTNTKAHVDSKYNLIFSEIDCLGILIVDNTVPTSGSHVPKPAMTVPKDIKVTLVVIDTEESTSVFMGTTGFAVNKLGPISSIV